jgi:hypothetical protein
MKSENIKTKNSRIPLLWKSGMVLIGLIFASFVFAQIPYEEGKVYVCPLATKMEEINPRCDCRIDLILGETVTKTCGTTTYEMTLTITEHEGEEYFAILGFENGGAGVNFEPKAEISAPFEGYVGQEILFDGLQSFDPNGDPLSFRWDFGDGNFGEGGKTTHLYQNPGEYLIILTVSDGMISSFATATIKILESPLILGSGSFGSFATKTKEISSEEKIEKISQPETMEKLNEHTPQKESKILEKITKILKVEKPEEKKEGTSRVEKKELKIPEKIQNFIPFLLASLKETFTTPPIIVLLIFLISVLFFILIKEIKMLKRK